ncbi:hypothetical protein EDC26_102341 [Paralcaligenes ureilyticus]|uniref:Uncharacterized protein n=1 Tax=Paralcaligenes ureilyticus TaxID=627131 RepID=A0A4R3M9X1_9BURK|nr:hypothetical protein EDC26_102341 [Paralcaligenes ureilyticus]
MDLLYLGAILAFLLLTGLLVLGCDKLGVRS